MSRKYWWFFIRNSEEDMDQLEPGQTFRISKLVKGTASPKLLEDYFNAAKEGDRLLISVFTNSDTKLVARGLVSGAGQDYIEMLKLDELVKPLNHSQFKADELISQDGVLDELGTLKPMGQQTYEYIVEDLLGEEAFEGKDLPQEAKDLIASLDGGQGQRQGQEARKKSPISVEMAQALSTQSGDMPGGPGPSQDDFFMTRSEYQTHIKLIIKFIQVSDDKEKVIELLEAMLED